MAELITKADVDTYFENGSNMDKFMDLMNTVAGTRATEQAEPFFIVLGGSPGVGKSTSIRKIMGDSRDYFILSLDNIVENYEPYREKSRGVVKNLTEINLTENKSKYNEKSALNTNFKKIDPIISKLSGPYLSVIHYKSKEHKILYLRNEILKEAMRRKYNIIFDTTFNPQKDIIEENIFKHMSDDDKNIYKKFKIIHVFAEADKIRNQLNRRHKNYISKKNYIRGVPKSMVESYVMENREGFENAYLKYGDRAGFEFCEYENKEGAQQLECKEPIELAALTPPRSPLFPRQNLKIETAAPVNMNALNALTSSMSGLSLGKEKSTTKKRGKKAASIVTGSNIINIKPAPKSPTRRATRKSPKTNSNTGTSSSNENKNKKKETSSEPEPEPVPSVSRYGRIRKQAGPK